MPPIETFEYMLLQITSGDLTELNRLSKEGWQVVQIVQDNNWIWRAILGRRIIKMTKE